MSLGSDSDAKNLVTQLKKQGLFDEIRRDLLQKFKDSSTNDNLREAIQKLVDDEAKKDPGLVKRDRGKSAALLEGVISRQGHDAKQGQEPAYKRVTEYIDSHTVDSDELRKRVEMMIRQQMGENKEDEGDKKVLDRK